MEKWRKACLGIIRWLLTLYLFGFFLYYSFPIAYVPYLNYSMAHPAPKPFQRQCAYVINPKTVYNSPLGNPKKLEEYLKGMKAKAYHTNKEVISYRDLGLWRWLAYFVFEYIPKKIVFQTPNDPYSLLENPSCKPFASDMPIVLSLWTWDLPDYSFILKSRKNIQYSDDCLEGIYEKLVPYMGSKGLSLYTYSNRGFAFPGDEVKLPSLLVVEIFEKRALVFLQRDKEVYKVFDQRSIREKLQEKGAYRVYAYTYQYRLWRFYFGLRFLFCTPPFQAM